MKKTIPLLLLCATSVMQMNAQEFLNLDGRLIPVADINHIRTSYQEHPQSLSILLKNDENISIFTAALEATGLIEELKHYLDNSYSVGNDSIDWTNPALLIYLAQEYDNVAYMEKRYIKSTVFAETDQVFSTNGIQNLGDLRQYAKTVYDEMYPEDKDVTDEKDPRNSLNRFVAYHILPFDGAYYKLTCVDGPNTTILTQSFNRRVTDIRDYYETMMPHSLMKFSFPSGSAAGLYINRRGVQNREDQYGVFVRGALVMSENDMATALPAGATAVGPNGRYYYIDDIISYGKQTQQVVLNERMRMDASTLSPDFMTSGARGFEYKAFTDGKYAMGAGNNPNPLTNNAHCLAFKPGAVRNFTFNDDTHLHVRPRYLYFWSYEGDEVAIKGKFDVTVKLPPVPAGTYEVRLGTCVGFASRGIVQFYVDNTAIGIPFDMRKDAIDLFGWQSDNDLRLGASNEEEEEEAIATYDKTIHNLGWMKGPGDCCPLSQSYQTDMSFRNLNVTIRKVIATFTTDGKTDHYLRMRQMMESTNAEFPFDYIELVPSSVYDNKEIPEDRW